ncbi:MAG TPA: phage tail protein [Thermosulfurimonas dismutans]|uniref:Phage tail protein n=1 Tax=Thermosulfurimonas dismutans TaxID=999894 RepID=A0A7C3GDP0_9BACT|nr:phage tail protein [Thermosulfurimonas dismutans]
MLGSRRDPLLAYRFLVECEGLLVAGFQEISGLELSLEVEEVVEGGVNDLVHRLPKGIKAGTLVLRRGICRAELWEWFSRIRRALSFQGPLEVRTLYLVILDEAGEEALRLAVTGAYPVKWTGPELKADQSGVALESLELVYTGVERV